MTQTPSEFAILDYVNIALSIANTIISLALMAAMSFMGWKFWQDLRAGKNGLTGSLMWEKILLANLFFYLSVSSFAWAYPNFFLVHAIFMQMWRLASLILVAISFILQWIEFNKDGNY